MIIGITGPQGAGKTQLADYLVHNYGAKHLSVRKFLQKRLPQGADREAMVNLANHLRRIHDSAYIVNELLKEAKGTQLSVIESIRTVREADHVKIHRGYLLGVNAPQKLRYERAVKRGSATDKISFEQFQKDELREAYAQNPNEQNITACLKKANAVLKNDATLEDFYKKIDRFMYRH